MKKNVESFFELGRKYDIPVEDIILIDINLKGINVNIEEDRFRFYLTLDFTGEKQFYCAVPIRKDSRYTINNGELYYKGESIGKVERYEIDICDTLYYMRRNGTALNINPKSKVNCRGCKFCYTSHQKPQNMLDLTVKDNLDKFFEGWMEQYNRQDLTSLYRIGVVSGCFPNENAVVSFLTKLNEKSKEYGFNGGILYFGSQIQTESSLKILTDIQDFSYCFTLECFENREEVLDESKSQLDIAKMKEIMAKSVELGFNTNFSYIAGLDSLESLKNGFSTFIKYTNKFPIINIFQEHQYQVGIREKYAQDIEFYLKARKIIESIYQTSIMRPQTWEIYRSLWYTSFGNEKLDICI